MVAPSWITTEPDPIKMPARIRPGWAPRPNKSVKLVRGWDVPEGMGAGQEFVDDAGQPRHFGSDLPPLASATEDFPLFNAMVEARKNAPPPEPPAPEAAPEPGPTVESQQPGGETAAPAESLTSEQPPATVSPEQPQSRATPKAAPVNRGVLSDSGAATQTVARAGGSSGAPARAAPPPQGPSPASRTTTVSRSNPSATQQSFVQENLTIAKKVSAETGIPYQLLLAIPGNETGWGKAMAGNNYFGIKGKNPKTGANTGSVGTWEVVNGQRVNINDTFRAYSGYEESARDFAAFLNDNPRYGKALEYLKKQPDDWRGFVREVHAAGYATDPAWSDKIINIGNGIGDSDSPAVLTPQSQSKLPPDKTGRVGVQSVIDVGSTQIGSKYKWGGAGGRSDFSDEMANTDCSGFVAWAYQKATGHKLTAYTGSMWNETTAVAAEDAAPGDLVMYGMGSGDAHQQHVGIYMGNGQFLHDSSVNPNGGVDITPLWKNASFRRVPVDPNLANYSTRDAGRSEIAPDDQISHWYSTVHGGRKVFIAYTVAGNTITDDLGPADGMATGTVLGHSGFGGMGMGQDDQPGYIAPEGLAYRPMPLGAGQDSGEEITEWETAERLRLEEENKRLEEERQERERAERAAESERLQRSFDEAQKQYTLPEKPPEPNPIQGAVSGLNEALEGAFQPLGEVHRKATEAAEQGTLPGDLAEAAGGMTSGIKEAVGGAFDALGSAVQDYTTGYQEALATPTPPQPPPKQGQAGEWAAQIGETAGPPLGEAAGALGETLQQIPPLQEVPGRIAAESVRKGADIGEYLQSPEGQQAIQQADQATDRLTELTAPLNPVTAVGKMAPGAKAIFDWIAANKDGWGAELEKPVPAPTPPEKGSLLERATAGNVLGPHEQAALVWEGYEAAEKMRREAVQTALPPEIRSSPEGFALTEAIVLATDPTNAVGTFGGAPKVGKAILTEGGERLLANAPEGMAAIQAAREGTTRATPSIAAHIQRTEKAAEEAAALAGRRAPARDLDAAALVSQPASRSMLRARQPAEAEAGFAAGMPTGGRPGPGTPEEIMAEAERARAAASAHTTATIGTEAVMLGTPEEIAFGNEVIEALDRPYSVKEAMEILQTAYLHLNNKDLENSADVLKALQASGAKDEPLTGDQLRRVIINAVAANTEVLDFAPERILKQTDEIMKAAGHPLLSTDAAVMRVPAPEEILNARFPWYAGDAASQAKRFEEQRKLAFAAMGKTERSGAIQAVQKAVGWTAPVTARGAVGGALGAFHEIGTTPGDQEVDYGKATLKAGVTGFATAVLGSGPAVGLVRKGLNWALLDNAAKVFAPVERFSKPVREATQKWAGDLELANQLSKGLKDEWIRAFGTEIKPEEQAFFELNGRFTDDLMKLPGAEEAVEHWKKVADWAVNQGLIDKPITTGGFGRPEVYIPHILKKNLEEAAIDMGKGGRHGMLTRNPMRYFEQHRQYSTMAEGMTQPGYGGKGPDAFEYSANMGENLGNYYEKVIQAAAHRLYVKRLEEMALQNDPALLTRLEREALARGETIKGKVGLTGEQVVHVGRPGRGILGVPRYGVPLSGKDGIDGFKWFPELEGVYVSQDMKKALETMMGGGWGVRDIPGIGDFVMDANAMFKMNVLSGIDAYHIINEIRQLFATQGWNSVVGGKGAGLQAATGVAGAAAGVGHELTQEHPTLAGAAVKGGIGFLAGTAAMAPIGLPIPGAHGAKLTTPGKWLPEPMQGGGSLWMAFAHALDPGMHKEWLKDPFIAKRLQQQIRDGLQMTVVPDLPEHLSNKQRFGLAMLNMSAGGISAYQASLKSGASQEDAVKWGIGGAVAGTVLSTPGGWLKGNFGKEQRSIVETIANRTFDQLIPYMKFTTYEMYAPKFGGRHAAEFTNEVFGGQNILAIGRSRMVQDAMRLAILAPDWQEGWARLVGNGLFNWGADKPVGTMARIYWRNALVQSAVMLEGMNLAINGTWSWQNDPNGTLMVNATNFYDKMGWSRTNPNTGDQYTPYWDILGPYRGMLEPLVESARWTLAGTYNNLGFKPERIPLRPETYGRTPYVGMQEQAIPTPQAPWDAWAKFVSARGGILGSTMNEVITGKDFAGNPIDRADDQEYQKVSNRIQNFMLNMLPTGQAEFARASAMGESPWVAAGNILTGSRPRRIDSAVEHFQTVEEIKRTTKTSDADYRKRRQDDWEHNQGVDKKIANILSGRTGKGSDDPLPPGKESDATATDRKNRVSALGADRRTMREMLYEMAGRVEGPERELAETMIQAQQEMEIVPGRAVPADLDLEKNPHLDVEELFRLAWNRDPSQVAYLKGEPTTESKDVLGKINDGIREWLGRQPGREKEQELTNLRNRWTVKTALDWGVDPAVMNDIVKARVYEMGTLPPLPGVTSEQLDDLTDQYQAAGRTNKGKNITDSEMAALYQQEYLIKTAGELGLDPKVLYDRIKLRTLPATDTSPQALSYSHARDVLNESRLYKYQNPDGSPFGTPEKWAEYDKMLAEKTNRFDYVDQNGVRIFTKGPRHERDQETTDIYNARRTAQANKFKDVRASDHKNDYYRWYGDGAQMTDGQWQQYTAGTLPMWRDNPDPREAQNRNEAMRVWGSLTNQEKRQYGIEQYGHKRIAWRAYRPNGTVEERRTSLWNYMAYINLWRQDKYKNTADGQPFLGELDPLTGEAVSSQE